MWSPTLIIPRNPGTKTGVPGPNRCGIYMSVDALWRPLTPLTNIYVR
jgi:hypothetical protein